MYIENCRATEPVATMDGNMRFQWHPIFLSNGLLFPDHLDKVLFCSSKSCRGFMNVFATGENDDDEFLWLLPSSKKSALQKHACGMMRTEPAIPLNFYSAPLEPPS